MKEWAKEELKYVDLGDRRRNCRLVKIVSDLAAQPESSVPQASGDWAGTKAEGRILGEQTGKGSSNSIGSSKGNC